MRERSSYDYAIIRVVPRVERGECINVGVILFCRTRNFLGALTSLDERRLLALAPTIDLELVRRQLQLILLICAGKPEAGSIACLSLSERFHWLISPRSTIIQTSSVHCGLCDDPEAALRRLLQTMVVT
ncbi:MAG TPA: DUF3037 domain-containing protein [Ktedonobacteraceae bacterium]|jgi:hypothetical protein|nr:DUF3037 domain-containing protein [Ktedonobacteraceae bacterium]